MTRTRVLAAVVVTCVLSPALWAQTPAPAPAPAAPAALTPADAASWLGDWTIEATGPMGPATFLLTMKVTDAKVVAEISSDAIAKTAISDITKQGGAVVLRYSFDYQGNPVASAITLTPAASAVNAVIDFADGAYTMNGTATKKK